MDASSHPSRRRKAHFIAGGEVGALSAQHEKQLYTWFRSRGLVIDLTLESLRTFCEGKIARFKQVRRLVLRAEPLPRNASGKVLKHEARAALAEAGKPEGPKTPVLERGCGA